MSRASLMYLVFRERGRNYEPIGELSGAQRAYNSLAEAKAAHPDVAWLDTTDGGADGRRAGETDPSYIILPIDAGGPIRTTPEKAPAVVRALRQKPGTA